MKVRYIYSACVSIETEDCTVLCDPWFGEAYEGAWVQWPRIENPLEVCGTADYVFLSHVHPDHYDARFLEAYLARYKNARVLIAAQTPPILERKLRSRGIEPIIGQMQCGDTTLVTVPNTANRGLNIDSALVVKRGSASVANLNDNPYDRKQIDAILSLCGGFPTVALLPFAGAGPWPQCYEFDHSSDLDEARMRKRDQYIDQFKLYCAKLNPHVAVPFAGQYWLHGEQLDLNPLRGMADATECRSLHPVVWVPADGGQSTLTIEQDGTSHNSRRDKPYHWPTVRAALAELTLSLRHEREIYVPAARLPLRKLLESAAGSAVLKRGSRFLYVCIKATPLTGWFVLNIMNDVVSEQETVEGLEPRMEVTLDARLLFGMLTRLYNANSARIGSLCRFRQVPAEYDEELYDIFGDYWDSLRV